MQNLGRLLKHYSEIDPPKSWLYLFSKRLSVRQHPQNGPTKDDPSVIRLKVDAIGQTLTTQIFPDERKLKHFIL